MDDQTKAGAATPPQDLEQQIMSSNVPKNEREWWATREIERLRAEVAALKAPVDMEPVAYTDWTRPDGLRWSLPDSPGIPDGMPLYSATQLAQLNSRISFLEKELEDKQNAREP